MPKPLEVIVTSGGTISRIDDIRHIGNFSKGTTGALIAGEFLRSGAIVHYVYGGEAKRPFREGLVINPNEPLEHQIKRAREAYEEFSSYSNRLHEHPYLTFDEYYKTVEELLTQNPIDVIVLAAAVSDYGAKQRPGKISSELEEMQIELKKNPKVISLVKEWNPSVFQVGFKLLSDSSVEELINVAYQHGIKNHSNLTVANTLIGGDLKQRATVLITPEKGLMPVSMLDLAPKLVEIVNQRVSKQHYGTKVIVDTNYPKKLEGQITEFKSHVQRLWRLNLFEPYFKGADMHFGYVATRVLEGGFLITSRGSNKKDMPLGDIVYIPRVDYEERDVYVYTLGKKASLNANVAAKIFEERPEVNVILHAHVFPGIENKTQVDYSPGTQEDVDEVMKHLRGKEKIVELINHGIISVGSDLEEVISALDIEPAYTKFPKYYDLIYNRFQHSPEFLEMVTRFVREDEEILELAAGTGDVSNQLLEKGYKKLSLADKSAGMLEVAIQKIGKSLPTYVTQIQTMNLGKTFDAIIVRQAINYLMDYEGLVAGFCKIKEHLNPGANLIFNAPNFQENMGYNDKFLEYDAGNYNVKVSEMNVVEGRVITHTQHCVLMRKDALEIKKLYDLNRFGLFTKEEFEKALQEAGFSSVRFFGKGLVDYTPQSRTIYCLATR